MDTMAYDYTEPTLSTKGQRMRDILAVILHSSVIDYQMM